METETAVIAEGLRPSATLTAAFFEPDTLGGPRENGAASPRGGSQSEGRNGPSAWALAQETRVGGGAVGLRRGRGKQRLLACSDDPAELTAAAAG
ncbi:hypothetical protein ANANG_G00164940, partial [Anguilla anguilla]